jgi:predicted molibdopterin-dependent oxidoreductase YjgC
MKLSRAQLRNIKNKVRQHDRENNENKEKAVNPILVAKKAIKQFDSDEEKINLKELRRKIKNEVKDDTSINISWGFKTGDAVRFKNRDGEYEVGIIIDQKADGKFRSIHGAKRGSVKVMSTSGMQWFYPTRIEKITEE